jgi:hypothetical protein
MKCSIAALLALALLAIAPVGHAQADKAAAPPANPVAPEQLDQLLGPIALYPDALVSQILSCSVKPDQVKEVNAWLKANPDLKGTAAQDGASDKGFDAAFTAIVLFPDVLQMMADKIDWTTELGKAFQQDRPGVLSCIQRLRAQAKAQGNLKTSEQQSVETVKSKSGAEVIVIQPANPQVVYVPQYNPQVVYVQPAPPPPPANTGGKAAAGLIGFTAGVIIGAAIDNDDDNFHHGYGGWGYRGPMLSEDGWEEFADHREDMAKDYYDHRENMAKQRGENSTARREASGENQAAREASRTENQGGRQASRTENQATRTDSRAQNQTARQDSRAQNQSAQPAAAAQSPAAGGTRSAVDQASKRSYQDKAGASSTGGNRSDAFSGYQKGSTERASSARGNNSVSRSSTGRDASGGGGGGGRRGR